MSVTSLQIVRFKLGSWLALQRARVSLGIFGNSLKLKTNALYAAHHFGCRLRSRPAWTPSAQPFADTLRTKGAVKLSEISDVRPLADPVRAWFEQFPPPGGNGTMEKQAAAEFAPQIYTLLQGQVGDVLRAHYRSHFQVYWSTIMHYSTVATDTAASSFGWHIDDNPRELLKVFFYLNDTTESNAAFRAFDYSSSRELFRRGFISSTPELRIASQGLITDQWIREKLNIFEGPAGTTLIFDNNLVHKGTAPRQGYRNVVCVEVYPGNTPVTVENVRRALCSPIKVDYPLNPFFNDIQRT